MSKITDEKQEYEYSFPQVWPDGSEFTVYSTKDNGRMVLRHTSGSHIEFKSDGSIFIKAIGDIHLNSSINEEEQGKQKTSLVVDTDLNIKVNGEFGVDCDKFVVKANTAIEQATNDYICNGNTMVLKSKEQISLEATKSIYASSKEYVENVTRRLSSIGEPGAAAPQVGGQNTMDVMGNTVIRNLDPNGGITIQSAGYLNLVCGAERVDVTGDPIVAAASKFYLPSINGRATYTHLVRPNPGPNPRGIPGSMWIESLGKTETIIGKNTLNVTGVTTENYIGAKTENITGPSIRNIIGTDTHTVSGIFKVTAATIFLN